MISTFDHKTVIVFDLDDTLYDEIDYLRSAFKVISYHYFVSTHETIFNQMIGWYNAGENVFQNLINSYNCQRSDLSIEILLEQYRNHYPSIKLRDGARQLIDHLKSSGCNIGLITDGRSVTQRNKIAALGLNNTFDLIVISEEFGSEKPSLGNFLIFQETFKNSSFVYIADNPKKDFITPNSLGWKTICVRDKGRNIHPQDFNVDQKYLPQQLIGSLNHNSLPSNA